MYKVIGVDNQVYGPVDVGQIRQWIQERRLSPESQLQKEGDTDWRPLSAFPEFAELLAAAAPPAPSQPIPVPTEARPTGGTSGMAIGGFVCGLLSLVCCGPLFGLIGLILSGVALSQISKGSGQSGRGLALAGVILSIIGFILTAVFLASGAFSELMKEFAR